MSPVPRVFRLGFRRHDPQACAPLLKAVFWLFVLLLSNGPGPKTAVLADESPHHGHAGAAGHDSATVRHRFEDAEHWAKVFEDPARDEWQRPDYVVRFVGLDSADRVADIGSATGYFGVHLARAVPAGKVFGIDIEPSLVDFLNRRAEEEGLGNLKSLLGEPSDPKIPGPVDLIFLCDTYHHIDGRVEYFHNLQNSLATGGRIVIVDFKPGELPVGPGPAHKIDSRRIAAEMYAAGYDLIRTDEALPYQFILEFRVRPPLDLKRQGPGNRRDSL